MDGLLVFVFIAAVVVILLPRNRKTRQRKRAKPFTPAPPGRPVQQPAPRFEPVAVSRIEDSPAKFYVKKPLTDREQGCYYRLVSNLGPDFIVLAQVAFSQILQVRGGTQDENFRKFATMRQKVADFLICRKDFTILAVVELDDRSHRGKEEQDKARDEIFKQAGLLVFRLPNTPNNEPVQRLADVLRRMEAETLNGSAASIAAER